MAQPRRRQALFAPFLLGALEQDLSNRDRKLLGVTEQGNGREEGPTNLRGTEEGREIHRQREEGRKIHRR